MPKPPTAAPTVLDQTLAIEDPRKRVTELTAYLDRIGPLERQAREARLAAVAELRRAGVTWRELATLSGMTEQYLRGKVNSK